MHQLPGCRSAAEAVREPPLRGGLKRCGGTEAGGWVTSQGFSWAGFQMLRSASMMNRGRGAAGSLKPCLTLLP